MHPLHHHIIQVKLEDLHPTQVTIGFVEVASKRAEWEKLSKKARKQLVAEHWFPSVLGPKGRYFIIDHHHLGKALHEEGQQDVKLTVLKDLSWLDMTTFWRVMEFHQWVHPYDEQGRRVGFDQLPQKVSGLKDDPYRGLAGLARNAGAFAKDLTPYSEFLWADYFRARLPKKTLKSEKSALEQALLLASHAEASYLPGWVGRKT
jgi:hypothetical protein